MIWQVRPLPGACHGRALRSIEEEGEHGILRTLLIVSPRVGALDDGRARDVFLEALGAAGGADRIGTDFWRRAGTVQVRRQWPLATGAGKVLPFHVARPRSRPSALDER